MNNNKTYLIALFFLIFSILIYPSMPHWYTELPENISDNGSDIFPLMSLPDDFQKDTVPGWWKHTGKSSVSYGSTGIHYVDDTGGIIDLEILLNENDADVAPGPEVKVYSQVRLEYVLTNKAS